MQGGAHPSAVPDWLQLPTATFRCCCVTCMSLLLLLLLL
jgi:hypothetical protein